MYYTVKRITAIDILRDYSTAAGYLNTQLLEGLELVSHVHYISQPLTYEFIFIKR